MAKLIDFIKGNFPDNMELTYGTLAATVGCLVVPLYVGYRMTNNYLLNKRLRKIIEKRQLERSEGVDKIRQKLATKNNDVLEKRQKIVQMCTQELISNLQNDSFGPVEVLEAFQWNAIKAQELTNCICLFVSEAGAIAEALEQQYRGSTKKPSLYGIPFSVKESIKVKGYDQTGGYVKNVGQRAEDDALAVQLLRKSGAIPFVLTNVPQSLLSFSCSNPIYGTTSNPVNKNRTSGGSTGGEGALIGCNGSPLGIGADVGGSIRMPCHWCGICGLKPCKSRISQVGSKGSVPGRPLINASIGPMARDIDALAIFMKTLLSPDMYSLDSYVVPVPFRDDVYKGTNQLTIGYYDFDGYMPVAPACRRAVDIAKNILQKSGHKLVKFQPPNMPAVFSLFLSAVTVDGGQYLAKSMENEIVDPDFVFKLKLYRLPLWLKRMLCSVAQKFSPDFGDIFRALSLNTSELRAVYEAIDNYREFYTKIWREMKLDAVICPPNACPAMTYAMPGLAAGVVSYAALFNLLDFPAGVVPICKVIPEDEADMKNYDATVGFYANLVKKDCSSDTVGLPVGVQCAALPFNEEICLRVMKEIEVGLKK